MSLSSFIAEFREYYSRNTATNELGDSLIGASAKQAVRKISKFKPRANQRTDLNITDGSTYVEMPANFMRATIAEIYRVKTGFSIEDRRFYRQWLSIFGRLSFDFDPESSRFRED